jgi:L-ribulose-5-phosphate 4-epimerase
MLDALKQQVCDWNRALPRYNLVVWTSGNVSARDPQTGLIVIKPSGIEFDDLRPEHQVVVDVDGNVVEGSLKPSSDTLSHCYIYRQRPDVFGITHTHSNYATAFAAVGKSIPCVLTAMGDEFGGAVPCAGFALIGSEAIGRQVVEHIGNSPAVLLQRHGVFTVGKSGKDALKAAVMVEDIAKTVWLAMQLGSPEPISAEDVAKLNFRYQNVYGQ